MIDRKELVKKMLRAYGDFGLIQQACNIPGCMDAALSVAVDELLKEPTPDERAHFRVDIVRNNEGLGFLGDVPLANFIGNRRAQLERVKTPEERVTVEMNRDGWRVSIDGVEMQDRLKEGIAKAARIGLIQQLKGSA